MNSQQLKILIPCAYFTVTLLLFYLILRVEPLTITKSIGASIAIVSFILWIVARLQLGGAFGVAATPKDKLVTHGLYSKLRHPVYYFSGLALIGIGVFLQDFQVFIAVAVIIILQIVRIREEDKQLAEKFGKKYQAYRKKTWL